MKLDSDRRLRGLFVVEADKYFDENHHLWSRITELRKVCDEVHLVVINHKGIPARQRFSRVDQNFCIYYFQKKMFPLGIFGIWNKIKAELLWQRKFRMDFVMSFNMGIPAYVGYFIARRSNLDFFAHGKVESINSHNLISIINKIILRNAKALFVSGKYTIDLLSKNLPKNRENFVVLTKPVDLVELNRVVKRYDFKTDYPTYTLFISTVVYTKKTIKRVLDVHSKIKLRYPHCCLIIIADDSVYRLATRISKRHKGAFVYKKDESLQSYLRGTTIYLALSHEQDFDTAMLTAFGLSIPVVVEDYGIARDLFVGSPYSQFLTPKGETWKTVFAVIKLIEDQYLRNQYGLNNPSTFGIINPVTTPEYTDILYKNIESFVVPVEIPSASLTTAKYAPKKK